MGVPIKRGRQSRLALNFLGTATTLFALYTSPAAAQSSEAQQSTGNDEIPEIVVTATKREENAQDIPITIKTLDETLLRQEGIGTFQDYITRIPGVTSAGRGPGQSSVYMRGMATDTINVQLAGSNGQAPNVALYLDEQPVTQPGRNLDVYITDVERIEVLPGPQGTLFGSSSQAGVLRIIPKKPLMNGFEAGVSGETAMTQHGDPSHKVEGFFNFPIIEDRLAVRVAAFFDRQGGYIDNIAATKSLSSTNPGLARFPDLSGVTFISVDNAPLVKDDFNDATYSGVRASLKWAITDNVDLLVSHMRQKLEADGVFDYDPDLGDLNVARFSSDELDEKWDTTSWTLRGEVLGLEAIYTGSFFNRDVEQSIDYTGYSDNGPFIPYYICDASVTYGPPGPPQGTCQSPVLTSINHTRIKRHTHEFRVTTPADRRLRGTVGVFYDRWKLKDLNNLYYPGSLLTLGFFPGAVGFPQNAPFPTQTAIDRNPRPLGVVAFQDITRTQRELGVFGEATFDIVPDKLAATVGARYYNVRSDLVGGVSSSFFNRAFQTDVDMFGVNLDELLADLRPHRDKGTIFKANVSWTPNRDMLFYATWSEGFRAGGFNRGCGQGNATFGFIPCEYDTDDVTNHEAGWKLNLLDRRLQWNGSVYLVDWKNIQTSVYNPNIYIFTFNDNAADARIKGLDTDVVWIPVNGFTLRAAASILDTEITDVVPSAVNIAPVGSELAFSPKFQGNLTGRYEWDAGRYRMHVQTSIQYSASSFSSIVVDPNQRYRQDEYANWNAAAGIDSGQWRAELFVNNITDKRADLFINDQDENIRVFTNRPRTIGLRLGIGFGAADQRPGRP